MNLLLLSGESILNKAWIENVAQTLKPLFAQVTILYYDHWQTGQGTIDLEKEYSKLISVAKDFGDYVIFAKSIGTVLAVRGIYEHKLNPVKCVFVGPAFLMGESTITGFQNWIEGYSLPTLFVTKTNDPVAPASQLRDLLEKYHVQNFQFVEIPGDNHKYENIEELESLVTAFL